MRGAATIVPSTMHASPFFVLDPARRLRSRFGSCLGVILLALSLDSAAAFDLQGHRGARGLAPENTLAGFEQALALGVSTPAPWSNVLANPRFGSVICVNGPAIPVVDRHRPDSAAVLTRVTHRPLSFHTTSEQ